VRVPLDVTVEERFPLDAVTHPTAPPPEGEEFDNIVAAVVHMDAGKPILDLDELLRQELLVEVPMRALCGAACRGLCPRCGADLNQGPCACPPDEAASPLAQLGTLLEDRKGSADA
jgi:uncharacterized protein